VLLGLHFRLPTFFPSRRVSFTGADWLRLIAKVDYRPAACSDAYRSRRAAGPERAPVLAQCVAIHLEYLATWVWVPPCPFLYAERELSGTDRTCHHATTIHDIPYQVRIACDFLGSVFSVQLGAVASARTGHVRSEIASYCAPA
jgi:light-regulated signal transduction histidine kinase (bacteriophytochrome)